jgi:hypothetical protein
METLSTFELVSSSLFVNGNRPYPLQNFKRTDTTVSLAYTLFRNKSCARDKSVSICGQNRCVMTERVRSRWEHRVQGHAGYSSDEEAREYFLLVSETCAENTSQNILFTPLYPSFASVSIFPSVLHFVFICGLAAVSQTLWSRVIGLLMSNELEGIWKGLALT